MVAVKEREFSMSLTTEEGLRVKMIAERENSSFSHVIESAVKVFTRLPKDVRDVLVEAATDADKGRNRLEELSQRVMYQEAMRRLGEAADAVAPHIGLTPDPGDYDDAVVVESRA